jgi:hypothetical protein
MSGIDSRIFLVDEFSVDLIASFVVIVCEFLDDRGQFAYFQ